MTELDVTNLIAETNKHLKPNQQIHPDDPIVVNMIVNQQILEKQIATTNRKLGDMLSERFDQLITSLEQQVQRAEASAERMICNGGSKLEKQLDAAALRWEERLRKAGTQSEARMRRASLLAWTGAVLICVSASVLCGSFLGNFVFGLAHPPKRWPGASCIAPERHRHSEKGKEIVRPSGMPKSGQFAG